MNEANQYLISLGTNIGNCYITLPKVRGVLLAGSVALGLADHFSDLDMCVYYDELPTDEQFIAIRQQLHGSERIWIVGDGSTGSVMEAYFINGVECQIVHTLVTTVDEIIQSVLTAKEVKTPFQKLCSGTLEGIALHGEELIGNWKAKIANYPEELAIAMIVQHLEFFPVWGLAGSLSKRDITVWHYQILVETVHNLLGILAGINHVYFTTFQFKRTQHFINKLKIAPNDLGNRVENLFQLDFTPAIKELELLVRETVALIEQYYPQVDLTATRKRIDRKQQPWTME